jgi:transposase-like protein
MASRPAIFKWRQTEPVLILCAVRWYLRYSLSLRDVEELLEERGLEADRTTVWRWVQRFSPELEQRLRRHLKPTNKSWRVDETYVRVRGRWCYLYRAIDSAGATIDFLLSVFRDADAAKRLFRKALRHPSHPQPRVINTDLAPIYGSVIPDIKKDGILRRRCRHRPVQYLNNMEQDHRAIKRRVNAKQGFREFQAAQRTIQGYEAMNMMRKGQVRWVSGLMFAVKFSSSTNSSNWPTEPAASTVSPPNSCDPSNANRKLQHYPQAGRRGFESRFPLQEIKT